MKQQSSNGLALCLMIASAIPVETAMADPMTLQQAVAIGLEQSPELGQAQSRTGAAEAVRDAAKREWLPKVDVQAAIGLRHLENDARVNLGLSSIDEKPLYGAVTVDQPLFDFGRRSSENKAQGANVQAAQKVEAATTEQVCLNISKAYLQVLMHDRILKAAQDSLAFHEALAADVREGVARGAMSISEQQQAGERLQTAKVQVTAAQNDLFSARETLALLLGQSGIEVVMPESPGTLLPATLEEATERARTADPSVQIALARYNAARFGSQRAEREWLPTFALQGSYRHGKDFEGYRGLTKDTQGLVMMRWPLFDGGVNAARAREANSKESEARFALAAVSRDSELQVRIGWQRLQSLRERLREQEDRAAIATQVLESYKAQFGIGRRSLLDLLDARAALYNASVEVESIRAGQKLAEFALLTQSRQLAEFLGIAKPPVVASPDNPG